MSIAVLTQVYDEMRRLAIAGSMVAPGDFRLKKLVPPLEQAGAKAPVFAKVAEAVKAVVDSSEKTSSQALLELTTLVNAILYTQGEVGADGPLTAIETTDLGASATQSSARVLKPLLEALTTTGSGRFELIRDAHERGAFRDLRLVKPALGALDDVYAEIADFVAEQVLPLYGKAILPELRASFDLKGKGGPQRRLRLMHGLDPAGTRELVKQALEAGSKEVKVAAIECLGGQPEDLSYLLEQAAAKSQEVRQAAYRALAGSDDEAAIAVLHKAMNGKDLGLASDSLHKSRNPKVLGYLIAGVEAELAAIGKLKDKKEVSEKIDRTLNLLNCLADRSDPQSEAFLLQLFEQRAELAKIKGAMRSGPELNTSLVNILSRGTKRQQSVLAHAHATVTAEELDDCFEAARDALPADQVFAMFSPYLTAKVDEKKKQRDPAWARREAILEELDATDYYVAHEQRAEGELDPRWLDIAVRMEHLGLVVSLARPGHAAANAFLLKTFQEVLKKAKQVHECQQVIEGLIRARHPEATDAVVAVLEKVGQKSDNYYWFGKLLVDLPRSAVPRLEAVIPHLHERASDSLLGYLQQLRAKPE
jgi:hypothetical protein